MYRYLLVVFVMAAALISCGDTVGPEYSSKRQPFDSAIYR